MKDLFSPIVSESKLHPSFKIVKEDIGYSCAREMLNRVYNSVPDIDHDFVQQFQTDGFDARICELYFMATFQEMNFQMLRENVRPDFELIKDNKKIFVETVTSNPAFGEKWKNKIEELESISAGTDYEYFMNLIKSSTIKIALALRKKLIKKYWELNWVSGNPLVIAIMPFHHSMSLILTDSMVSGYLYGVGNDWYHDEKDDLIIETIGVEKHEYNGKLIPSGFFNQPDAQNISAVIYSNSGTISKFNRMGKQEGLGEENVRMIRQGTCYNHDPNASQADIFEYEVGKNGPHETWSQGISMIHNPNALYPIDPSDFPNIAHTFFDEVIYADVPDFHPFNSETEIRILK
jgi:hypothetical protein